MMLKQQTLKLASTAM